MAQPTALEQYLLEHVNAERAQVGAQPLASNSALDQAAEGHSQWMINTDTFSHTGAGGSDPDARMTAAGYGFGGLSWASGENIAWASTRAPEGYQDDVDLLHANLMNSPDHRANLLNGDFKEVGLAFEVGEFQGWQGAFVTEDFARSGTSSFLTGVAYADTNGNHAYDPGEGLGGLTVDALDMAGNHHTATTMDAGGYDLPLAPGAYSVTFENGSGATSAQSVTIGALNIKVDAVDPHLTPATPTATSDSAPTPDEVIQTTLEAPAIPAAPASDEVIQTTLEAPIIPAAPAPILVAPSVTGSSLTSDSAQTSHPSSRGHHWHWGHSVSDTLEFNPAHHTSHPRHWGHSASDTLELNLAHHTSHHWDWSL